MTRPMTKIVTGTALALCVSLALAAATPASAGIFKKKKKVVRDQEGKVVYVVPRGRRAAKYYIRQEPYILNNRVYPGMQFEPPNSAFFGGNPMIGPSSW
ncbi:hypothetical protein V6C03_14375 [Methyloligella sp. 2.7D]|uniref:hypothetical protein n=1 Tax=unclassified Methyloligella TaxID=2625955 RepID=UPI00157C286E|nr:hypothetical protein [Methyloligella sp. GL2]QKP77060.1 hypothetical protein HT051_06090 [Methyloligella sp. GL2]